MIRNDSETFRRAVDDVAKQLVTTEHRDGTSFIRVPMTYPSGSGVVIRINDNYPDFFVTDHGFGYDEAEWLGGSSIYARHAPVVAKKFGVGFDQHSFFVLKANREQLAGAIVTVANCAVETVIHTLYKVQERKQADATEKLFERLQMVFPRNLVSRDVGIVGHSNTSWSVATMVKTGARGTIFEPVSSHHSSVFAVTTKFHDIGLTDSPPKRVAVVKNKGEMDTYLGILAQAGDVIEQSAPDQTLKKLVAEAA